MYRHFAKNVLASLGIQILWYNISSNLSGILTNSSYHRLIRHAKHSAPFSGKISTAILTLSTALNTFHVRGVIGHNIIIINGFQG